MRYALSLYSSRMRIAAIVCALATGHLLLMAQTWADEPRQRFQFVDDAKKKQVVEGKVLTEAQDGGLLLLALDGRLWTVGPEQLTTREPAETEEFHPLTPQVIGSRLQAELGAEFEVFVTPHYVICTNTNKLYAQWCGKLFERLYTAFHNYWKQRGVRLEAPEFPLVALIFADEEEFAKFATKDAGPSAATAKGYYSGFTNRMVLYDLTATRGAPKSLEEVEQRVAATAFNVATVVHEATHQIAFNSGLNTRLADNPLWLTEGMALYCETPDLKSKTGWKTIGALNRARLKGFQEYASARRKSTSLQTLLGSDQRFANADTAGDAYAEAWALTYYLIRTKPELYVKYLNHISAKSRLVFCTPVERLQEFQVIFGTDFEKLDADFLKYMKRLRP